MDFMYQEEQLRVSKSLMEEGLILEVDRHITC